MIFVLNILLVLGLTCFESNCIDKNKIISEIQILQCNVIRIVHYAQNMEAQVDLSLFDGRTC